MLDSIGLTSMIHEIDAIMITVDPGHSIRYIAELTHVASVKEECWHWPPGSI